MDETFKIIVIYITVGLVIGPFCSFIAKEKNRNIVNWFILGFLFNLIALISLTAIPVLEKPLLSEDGDQSKPSSKIIFNLKAESILRILLFILGIALILIVGFFSFSN